MTQKRKQHTFSITVSAPPGFTKKEVERELRDRISNSVFDYWDCSLKIRQLKSQGDVP